MGRADNDLVISRREPLQFHRDGLRVVSIETCSRLVSKKDGRIQEQGSSEGYPLALASRETRYRPRPARDSKPVEEARSARDQIRWQSESREPGRQKHVAGSVELVNETEILEHKTAMAPPPFISRGLAKRTDRFAKTNRALRWDNNPGKTMQ